MEHVFWGAALLPPLKEVCVLGALLCPVRLKYLDQLGFVILAVSNVLVQAPPPLGLGFPSIQGKGWTGSSPRAVVTNCWSAGHWWSVKSKRLATVVPEHLQL